MSEQSGGRIGPAVLRRAVEDLRSSPTMAEHPRFFSEYILDGNRPDSEQLQHYATSKLVSDELAVTFDLMRRRFPPYGLPVMHREPGEEAAVWSSLTDFDSLVDTTDDSEKDGFTALHDAYTSKMIVFMMDGLEGLYLDPAFRPSVEALSEHQMSNYHINTGIPPREAFDRLQSPTDNAIDIMTGLMAILSEVAIERTGQPLQPEEALEALRNSGRTIMQMTMLSFDQLRAFMANNMQGVSPADWGWEFNADAFTIREADGTRWLGPEARFDGIMVSDIYEVNFGEEGDTFAPTEIILEPERVPLKKVGQGKPHWGCPAYELAGVMWGDMVSLAGELELYK